MTTIDPTDEEIAAADRAAADKAAAEKAAHEKANRAAAAKLRGAPTVTDKMCPTEGCRVFLLSDGICPRCNPRQIAPGPALDGSGA